MGRQCVCMNGLWDFQPGDGTLEQAPQNWGDAKIKVPSPWNINSFAGAKELNFGTETLWLRGGEYDLYPEYPKEWESAESGWYRRTFFVPDDWAGSEVVLCFNAVLFYAEFYVNGRLAAYDADGFLPVEFSVENYVKFGEENTIIVGVKKIDAFRYKDEAGRDKIEYPTGSFWSMSMGGIWQDVYLKSYPAVHIEDAFVRTDINECTVTVEIAMKNIDSDRYSLRFSLHSFGNDKPQRFCSEIQAMGQTCVHTFSYEDIKDTIKLWSPDTPVLYELIIELCLGRSAVDTFIVRFGFRRFEVRGNKFFLNNTPVNIRNDSWHYMGFAYQSEAYARAWFSMEKDANVNCVRLHAQVYPEFFLDVADEMGMLIIDESSIWASHCQYHYSREFIENGKRHVGRLVRRDRNHPSVIIWSVENECIMAYKVSADNAVKNEEELAERLFLLAEHASSLDPTRPVSGDGSNDMGGRLGIFSIHYPGRECLTDTYKPISIGEMGSLYYSTPDCVCNEYGERTYLSFDGRLEAIGRELFASIRQQRKWAAQVCVFNLVWYGLRPLPFRSRILEYGDYGTPGVKPTKIGPYISTLNAGYDDNLPGYLPNPVYDWVRSAYIPERFFFDSGRVRYYDGEPGRISLSAHNDSPAEMEYCIEWKVLDGSETFFENTTLRSVAPACHCMLDLEFPLPQDGPSIGKYTLAVSMMHGDEIVFRDLLPIKVYHRANLQSRVKCLEQFHTLGAGNDVRFKSPSLLHKPVAKAFVNWKPAVLMRDLEEGDLSAAFGWDNGAVASYTFAEPACANASNLVCTGKGQPLVLEVSDGGGMEILSTVDLVGLSQTEPAALVLLGNLSAYVEAEQPQKWNDCVLVSKKGSKLEGLFRHFGVTFTLADADDAHALGKLDRVGLLVADGTYRTDYLDAVMPGRVGKVVLWIISDEENIPDALKGSLRIMHVPQNQLVKCDESHGMARGLHTGDLYGLESGDEVVICEHPLFILDGEKVKGVLKNANLNWRLWNYQGEDRKTVSILRSELENRCALHGLAVTDINTVPVILQQLNYASGSGTLSRLMRILLTNMGLRQAAMEEDECDRILREGVYENGLKKTLVLCSEHPLNIANLNPEINRVEAGCVWNLRRLTELENVTGFAYYAFYAYSHSDRTDLLLNPDLVGIQIKNENDKKLCLNGEFVAEGKEIALSALKLKAGWNRIIIEENRLGGMAGSVSVELSRKENNPLDVDFSLEQAGYAELSRDQWTFSPSDNAAFCGDAIKGRGWSWTSVEMQRGGMHFAVDLGSTQLVSQIRFDSRVDGDCVRINTPKSFAILASLDGSEWYEIYSASNEERLSFPDGKAILPLEEREARYVKILITNVALKPLSLSELRLFTRDVRHVRVE